MQVAFESRLLGDLCNSGYRLVRTLGEVARNAEPSTYPATDSKLALTQYLRSIHEP